MRVVFRDEVRVPLSAGIIEGGTDPNGAHAGPTRACDIRSKQISNMSRHARLDLERL